MIWNYHDDDLPAPDEKIKISFKNIKARRVLVHHYRIDNKYSNSYEVWKSMGSPQNPSKEQIKELEQSGKLQMYTSPTWHQPKEKNLNLSFSLPRQGVSLVTLTW